MKNVLTNMNALEGVVVSTEMEQLNKVYEEAKKAKDEFGAVLSIEAVNQLTWTVDSHVGNIIGHYFADEASLVGITTYAGEILTAIRTSKDVLYVIDDEHITKDGKGKKVYVSQFTEEDMAVLTGMKGLKTKVVVVKGAEHAKKIMDALKNWNIADATDEEVAIFVADVTRMIRACQEIEIDITKDKTLVRFMDLANMLREGAYILTHKFKTQKTKTNPGLVTNIKELQKVRLEEDRTDITYEVSIGHLTYKVGNEEITEDISDRAEVITQDVVKIVNKEMVNGGIMDDAAKFQEKLMDKSIEISSKLVRLAKTAKTDYVITDTMSDIENNVLPQVITDLAQDLAPAVKAAAAADRIISFSGATDKKGLRKDLSDTLRNTAKKLWLADNHIPSTINKITLADMKTNFRKMFSKMVVASELVTFDAKTNSWGFELRHSIPTVKNLCKAEYLTLAIEDEITEFIVAEYPVFGVANELADCEVIVKGRNVIKDDTIVGRIITDKLSKTVIGRKFYIERNEEGIAMLVEKMSINAMGAFPTEDRILVTTNIVEFDEYTESTLLFNQKDQNNEEVYETRNAYVELVKEILTDEETIVNYSYELNALVVNEEVEFKLVKNSDTWKNMMLGLVPNPKLSPEENKKVNTAKAKEMVAKGYIVKDVFFSGNKLAMVLTAR